MTWDCRPTRETPPGSVNLFWLANRPPSQVLAADQRARTAQEVARGILTATRRGEMRWRGTRHIVETSTVTLWCGLVRRRGRQPVVPNHHARLAVGRGNLGSAPVGFPLIKPNSSSMGTALRGQAFWLARLDAAENTHRVRPSVLTIYK